MRLTSLTALSAACVVVLSAWPADAQTRRGQRIEREAYPGERAYRTGPRTRITVRRQRSFLDPGTEVLPRSQSSLDYAIPPLDYPTRIWDTTSAFRSPLPGATPGSGWLP